MPPGLHIYCNINKSVCLYLQCDKMLYLYLYIIQFKYTIPLNFHISQSLVSFFSTIIFKYTHNMVVHGQIVTYIIMEQFHSIYKIYIYKTIVFSLLQTNNTQQTVPCLAAQWLNLLTILQRNIHQRAMGERISLL